MIITETIKLKINSKIISHYLKLGYNVKVNKTYNIKVKDLTHGCKSKIKVKCDICDNKKEVSYKEYCRNTKNYKIYTCSNKCATIKNKKTSLKKYGVEHFSKSGQFVEKIKKTNLNKFGVEYYSQTDEYKKNIKNKNKNRDYTETINKTKKTHMLKYGVENYHQSQEYKDKKSEIIQKYKNTITKKLLYKYNNLISTDNNNYKFLCKKGHEFEISRELLKNRNKLNTEICTICNSIGKQSSGLEFNLINFIKENYKYKILLNKRSVIKPLELDIYLPELKIAFEFNGLYWHNELFKENNYHLNKTELCEKQGIQLIHIWEDNWLYKQEIVKSMILNKLNTNTNKIYGRKTEVKEITNNKLIRDFLDENHLQGFVGSKVKIGLFFDNELVSLMTFGKRRIAMGKKKTNDGEYELLRFCNKLNTTVIGGASKLFKYFINNYKPKEITTYADRSHSNGNLYKQLGFNFINKTQPNYYYIVDGIRKHRFNYRKDKLIKEGYDPNKTEHQIMIDRKIFRIYDSGNLKFLTKK